MSFNHSNILSNNNNSCLATPPVAAVAYLPPQMFSPANYTLSTATAPRAPDDLNQQMEKLSEEMKQIGVMSDRPTTISTSNISHHYAKSEPAHYTSTRPPLPTNQPCHQCQHYSYQLNSLTNKQAQLENQVHKQNKMLESNDMKIE